MAGGYGPLVRSPETVERLAATTDRLVRRGVWPDEESVHRLLAAADRLASAALGLAAHMTHARRMDLSGATLPAEAFKAAREGHTGGSLNLVPAFVGYLLASDTPGMLFANRCTWAHAAVACADLLGAAAAGVLTPGEMAAVRGDAHPRILQVSPPEGSSS